METKETIFQETKLTQSKTRTFELSSTTLSLALEETSSTNLKQSGELLVKSVQCSTHQYTIDIYYIDIDIAMQTDSKEITSAEEI